MTDTAEPLPIDPDAHDRLALVIAPGPTPGSLVLAGELDHTTIAVLRGAVEGELCDGHRRIVLDVADLRFVDAAGFRELGAAQDLAREHGGRVLVVGYDAFFAELARICDAQEVLGPE